MIKIHKQISATDFTTPVAEFKEFKRRFKYGWFKTPELRTAISQNEFFSGGKPGTVHMTKINLK